MTTSFGKISKLQGQYRGSKISRRQFVEGSLSAGLTIAAALNFVSEAEAAIPIKGGALKCGLAHGSKTDSLDPSTTENDFTIALALNTNNYLTEVDVDGSLKGELAESWVASGDAKTWRFDLRNEATHHNGKTVTPDDVIASINFHRAAKTKSPVGPLVKPIKSMSVDGNTVVIRLESGNADFAFTMSDYHFPVKPSIDGKMDWKDGVGAGGYVLKSFEPGIKAVLERNPNYWKSDRAHFESIELFAMHNHDERIDAVTSGDVHIASHPALKAVNRLAQHSDLDVEETSGTLHFSFPMLMDVPPLDNNDVRMALKLATDRQEILDKILMGHGVLGNDHPIGRSNRYRATDLPQRNYDPDKAKFHAQKAELSKIDLSVAEVAFDGALETAALMQEQASKAGIEINIVREANDGYWSRVWANKGWCACYWGGRPTEDWMFSTTHAAGGEWNDTHFKNDRFQKLLVEARSVLNDAKRRQMYVEMQGIVRDEGGTLVPMFANYIWAKSKKVTHGTALAANWDLDGQRYLERWWMV